LPDDVAHFREMTAADIPAGLALCRASRWNQTQRDWAQFLESTPHGARVAVRDGRVIGTVATIRYEDRFAWIGMVLVDPAERGHGVGTKLLEQGLDVLSDIACVRLDATPAGHGIYLKLGFEDEYGLARMEKAAAAAAPAYERNGVRLMRESDWPAVIAFDHAVFGADRGGLLDWMRAGAPEYARVVEDAGRLRGFCFGRHGFDFEHIGPIVAEDADAARRLAGGCLEATGQRRVVIDASRRSQEWYAWLASNGFTEQRPFTRMFRGEHRHRGAPERQFAILGPEFG
jgi:GNAT superfamily N-acetyltransferase